jgi:class 3 adenylate cyclase
MMKCPECQHENEIDAKFCNKCGSKLDVICPECGIANLPGSQFCKECGHNLTQPSEPAPKELSFDEKIEKIQKYLPGGVTEKVLAQRGKIEGERKQVTVLFADMVGSTPFMEKLGPEAAYIVMDEVYEILIHKVHEYEGTVNELTGDGIMALFGAPIAIENAPQRAIQSALEIHREITRFNDKKKSEGLPSPLKMRIGIHTGPVVVGTLGNDLRVEFKAVGDTVILASRLESMAEPGTTYITENTFKLTEGLYRFEALGEKEIKGKEYPVGVYRVIAPSTLSTRFEVNAERGLTPFVGRDRELELLLDGIERVKSGRGQAFSIVAEAGVGKTRLLYELRKAIANEDVTIREGRCLSYSQSEAYRPITDILKANFKLSEGDEDYQISEKVSRGLKAIYADGNTTLPYLLMLFGVDKSGIDKSISPEERKYQLVEAMKCVALKGSEIRPVIIFLEDLHWIDKGSEESLKSLFESIAGSRVMLIFTYRPEYIHTWGTKTYHNQIMLNRLSNRESLIMISHLLSGIEVDPALEEMILEKTEGVPFYIEEFLKSLIDLNVIQLRDGIYDLSKDAKELAIPSTIQDVIMARIDPLPDGVKGVIQTGSVIGREFDYELIKRVTGFSEQELLSHLSLLKDSELVYERGIYPNVSYTFKHALTREVAYNSILSSKRERHHEAISQAIEDLYSRRLDEYYETLAYHYSESKNLEKTYHYLKLSSDKALTVYAYGEAVKLQEQALQVQEVLEPEDKGKRCDLLLALGDALIMAGEPRRVVDMVAPEAWSLAEAINDRVRVSRVCKLAMLALHYYGLAGAILTSEASEWAERANRYAKPDTIERAWADIHLGNIKCSAGRNAAEGFTLLKRALELTRRLDDPETFWQAAKYWIWFGSAPQHAEERLHLAEELLERSDERSSLRTLPYVTALLMITDVFLTRAQRQRFEDICQEIRDLAERTRQAHSLIMSMTFDIILSHLDGRLEDAVDMSRRMIACGEEWGISEYVEIMASILLRPLIYLGRFKDFPYTRRTFLIALGLAHIGRDAEAADILDQYILTRPNIGSADDNTVAWIDIMIFRCRNPHPMGVVMWDRLCRSRMGLANSPLTAITDLEL